MPGKMKGKSRKRKADPLRAQVAMTVKLPTGRKIAKRVLQEVLENWISTGNLPEGFKILAWIFQNPNRKKPADRRWRTHSDADMAAARKLRGGSNLDVRDTNLEAVRLTLRRALQRSRLEISEIR